MLSSQRGSPFEYVLDYFLKVDWERRTPSVPVLHDESSLAHYIEYHRLHPIPKLYSSKTPPLYPTN